MAFKAVIHLSTEEQEKIKIFEELQLKMFTLSEETLKTQMQKLGVLRLSSSQTMGKQSPDAIDRWNKAQAYLFSNSTKLFQFETIKKLNEILTDDSDNERNQDIFAGGATFMSNEEKNLELKNFINNVLPSLSNLHPIVASTAIRYWLVSLHPFKDGNGRTAQSLGDAWLLLNQYPPLFFKNSHQGSFAYIPNYREDFNFNDALNSSFVGLDNAFKMIFG